MELQDRIRIFESISIPRAVASLAIPTILTNMVMIIYSLADTFFVGIIADPVQNAAVTLSGPLLLAFNAINNLFGVGCSSMISRSLGRKDYDTVRKISSFGFWISFFCAVCFALLATAFKPFLLRIMGVTPETMDATAAYLRWTVTFGACPAILNVIMAYMVRSEGSSLHASIGVMSGCLLNIILDPIFILPEGFGLGAEGAGIATYISNCFALFYFVILILVKHRRKTTFLSISPRDFAFSRSVTVGICAVGIPASIQNLLNVTGMMIFNNYAAAFGANAVAGIGIAQRIHNVPMSIAMGCAQGIMPLVSYNWASGNRERMKESLVFARRIMLIFLCAVGVVFWFFPDFFIKLFMDLPAVVDIGSSMLRGLSFTLPLLALDFISVHVFQAIGRGRNSLMFALTRKLFLEIPLLVILNRIWPLYGLPYAQVITEVVLASVGVVYVNRILREEPEASL